MYELTVFWDQGSSDHAQEYGGQETYAIREEHPDWTITTYSFKNPELLEAFCKGMYGAIGWKDPWYETIIKE